MALRQQGRHSRQNRPIQLPQAPKNQNQCPVRLPPRNLNCRLLHRCPFLQFLPRRQLRIDLPDFPPCPSRRTKLLRSKLCPTHLNQFRFLPGPHHPLESSVHHPCLTRTRPHRAKAASLLVYFLRRRRYSKCRNLRPRLCRHSHRCPNRSHPIRQLLLFQWAKWCQRNIQTLNRCSRFPIQHHPAQPLRWRLTRPHRLRFPGRRNLFHYPSRQIPILCLRLRLSPHNQGRRSHQSLSLYPRCRRGRRIRLQLQTPSLRLPARHNLRYFPVRRSHRRSRILARRFPGRQILLRHLQGRLGPNLLPVRHHRARLRRLSFLPRPQSIAKVSQGHSAIPRSARNSFRVSARPIAPRRLSSPPPNPRARSKLHSHVWWDRLATLPSIARQAEWVSSHCSSEIRGQIARGSLALLSAKSEYSQCRMQKASAQNLFRRLRHPAASRPKAIGRRKQRATIPHRCPIRAPFAIPSTPSHIASRFSDARSHTFWRT